MKLLVKTMCVMVLCATVMLTACNFNQSIKDVGEAVGKGAEAVVDAAKKAPKAIGDASNKIEADIRKE